MGSAIEQRPVLDGLRVLDDARSVAGSYVAKLLGDLGADVIKIEPPGGDPLRASPPVARSADGSSCSILFLHLNTSKRSRCLDLTSSRGVSALKDLIASADLLISERSQAELDRLDLHRRDLLRRNPSLVVVDLPAFGFESPYVDYRTAPLTTFHGTGEGYLTPVASHLLADADDRSPLQQGRYVGDYKIGTYAAALALAAVFHARASGEGQLVEIPHFDALLGLNFFEFQDYLSFGDEPNRRSLAVPLGGIMPCRDGYLQFTFHEEHQWRALVTLMGEPDWADESWASTPEQRVAHADEINARMMEWLRGRTRAEVVAEGQAGGVTVAPYLSVDEVFDSPQLKERHYFHEVSHPRFGTYSSPSAPWRFSGRSVSLSPAPELGQGGEHGWASDRVEIPRAADPAGPGPLAGIRVLDFTWAVAGPTATMILASLGAEVIKVESRLRPDVLRREIVTSATTNRQKRAITLNLRHERARALVIDLVRSCDAVAESFRPGVMDSLGLSYEVLSSAKADLVMLSSSMAGQHGPSSRFAGYAPMFVALSGLGSLTGYADGPPTQIRVGGDIIAGIHGATALVAALLDRQSSGRGAHIDLSSIEAQANMIGECFIEASLLGSTPQRRGNEIYAAAPHGTYRCAGEDQWVAISVESDKEWASLVEAMDSPLWATSGELVTHAQRRANLRALDEGMNSWTRLHTAHEVTEQLQRRGIAAFPCYRARELFADDHVLHRQSVVELPGEGGLHPVLRLGGTFSSTPFVLDKAGPEVGADTDEVLSELLGLSEEEIATLEEEGVLQ